MSEMNVERAVRERYSRAARAPEAKLCCSVEYDPRWLEVIPREILERDYGCGDPTRSVRRGETVLDLGSGAGKACYIAAQLVGPSGRVIGVDMNHEMLALAESHRRAIGERLGYHNVTFHAARIQDLALDLGALERRLSAQPVTTAAELEALEAWIDEERRERPLVADGSIDVVISNCVLNLVAPADKRHLFGEMARVLRPAGRAVISDIVSDEDVPERLQRDPELWSGCVSGALRVDRFLGAFAEAGFRGMHVVTGAAEPWQVVQGIAFRSVTVEAWKSAAPLEGQAPSPDEPCCGPPGSCC